jgi:GTP-binding protein Era
MTAMAVPGEGRWPRGRVGYVALLGRANAGKSTLLNTVLGQHLAAVSPQPQTTRRRLLGIYTDAQAQMLFLDAPGVHRPADELGQCMQRVVERTVAQADAVLCLVDPTREPGDEDRLVASRAATVRVPVLLALNKCDLASELQSRQAESFYRERLPAAPCFRISALDASSLPPLLVALAQALPEGPFLYPSDQVTDCFERDLGAELIREACLEHLRQEVPHAVAVTVDEWREDRQPLQIQATVHVERDSQKRIVVGRGGAMVAAIRRTATAKLAELCGVPIQLRLWVKVSPDWRERRGLLREFSLAE